MEVKSTNTQASPENNVVQRLQHENATLRAELEALRSITQTAASHSTVRAIHTQSFDFMKLPRELRNLVYELCVVVGNIYIAMPAKYYRADMRCQQPRDAAAATSLFAVSKQIRHEALELYLSRNHFILTTADTESSTGFDEHPLRLIPGYEEPQAFVNLRSISISLDNQMSMRIAHEGFEGSANFHLAHDSPEEIRSIVSYHNTIPVDLYGDFRTMVQSLFMRNRQLRKVQINLQNTVCALGCHRMVDVIFDDEEMRSELRRFALRAKKIELLDFLGTINEEERQIIRRAFPKFMRDRITFHGQFNSEDLAWNPEIEILDETPSEHGALGSSSDDYSSEDIPSEW